MTALRTFLILLVSTAFFLLSPGVAGAANVTLTTGDSVGTSSFDDGSFDAVTNWGNALDPAAGNDYFVTVQWLRTPADALDYTFAGDSLTLESGGGLISKHDGDRTVSANWILDGGLIRSGSGGTLTETIAGTMSIASGGGTLQADQTPYVLSAAISGAGDLSLTSGNNITVTGTSTMSGNVVADGSDLLWDTTSDWLFTIGASGTNNAIAGTGSATFDGAFTLDLTGASSTPGDSWTLTDVATQTFGSGFSITNAGFSQSGSVWTDGTYTFNPATGTLAVAAPPVEWNVDADGNWNTASNWSGGSVPAANGDVLLGTIITENRTVTLDSNVSVNSLTFNNPVNTGDYIIVPQTAEKLTLTGEAKVVSTGRHWLRAEVAGTAGLNLNGGGELVLDADNSFSGGVNVDGANLAIVNTDAIPAGNNISIQSGGQVRFWGADNAYFTGEGSAGYGTGTISTAVSIDSTSTLEINDGANVTFTGTVANEGDIDNDNGIRVNGGNATFTNTISGAGGVEVDSEGSATFSSAMTYTGVTQVWTDSTLTLTGSATLGDDSGSAVTKTYLSYNGQIALENGVALPATEYIQIDARPDGERVRIATSGNVSIAGNINAWNWGSGDYVEISSETGGTLTLGGTISGDDAYDRYYIFSGDGDFNLTGMITDLEVDDEGNPVSPSTNAGNNVHVIKRGSGTMTINTASAAQDDYWQGSTVVEGGTLVVLSDGTSQGELWSETIDVKAGATLDIDHFGVYNLQPAQNLGGGGTVAASTLGIWDDNSVTPGDSVGTLNINGAVTINAGGGGGGVLNFELGNTTTVGGAENDLIQVNGSVTTSGSPLLTVSVTPVEGSLATGTYRLINHSGGTTSFGSATTQMVSNTGAVLSPRQTLSVSGATSGQVNLTVSGSAAALTWNGAVGNNTWDVGTSSNWSGTYTQFRDLDTVTFGSGGVKDVAIASSVTPGAVVFNGGVGTTYTLTGSGGITGYAPISVNSGTVKLTNTGNDFVGITTIASGARLETGSSSTGSMVVNGQLSVPSAVNATLIDDFSGDLSNFTNTMILDANGGSTNTAAWQIIDGALYLDTTVYDGIEQYAMIYNGLSLAVGEEVQMDLVHNGESQDLGLYVGGTTPTTGTRQDYISMYARNTGEIFSRGFDGTTEYGQVGWISPEYSKLFIARTDGNTYEAGYYDAEGRSVLVTRTPSTANEGDVVGFYADVRAVGTLGSIDNLMVVSGESSSILDINGDLTLASGADLELDINAVGYSILEVTGSASLAGTLSVELIDGFMPSGGASYDLLSAAGGITDNGMTFDLPTLSGGLFWDTSDFFTSGTLSVASVDYDGDGDVDIADLMAWQRTDASADALAAWKSAFTGAALAGGDAIAAVPEPASLLLVAIALCGLAGRSDRKRR